MGRNLLVIVALLSALGTGGCATTGGADEEAEPTLIESPDPVVAAAAEIVAEDPKPQEESKQQEGEVPIAVAETAPVEGQAGDDIAEVVVQGRIASRHEA